MVKPVQKAEINSFVKGLVSEASPLNFPADASRDEENFELNRDGTRNRRLGMDFETDYSLRSTGYSSTDISNTAISTYKWFGAGNNPDAEFIVIQFGTHIDVYKMLQDSISASGYIGSVTITGASGQQPFSYASVDGKLIIAAGTELVHTIEWDNTSLQYSTSSLLIRDQWGLPDNPDPYRRPKELTMAHLYNLRNQGWTIPRRNADGTLVDPIQYYKTGIGKYPANSETISSGLQFQAGTPPFERMYLNLYTEVLGLGAAAAKGYFIIDALKRGTSRMTAEASARDKFSQLTLVVSGLKEDTTTGGCSIVTEFAGRVFYAGFSGENIDPETNSPNLSNYVLFSQLIKTKEDVCKCYQEGDPTSREGSDIVDTDGGFIRISGAKKIIAMKVLDNNLFVIADNGVWKIVGGSDYGFGATNYRVDKISTSGGINEKSVVEVESEIYFWGQEGIFRIHKNQFGDSICDNISRETIQEIYDEIPAEQKSSAVAVYDQADKKIRWAYGISTDPSDEGNVIEIILDLLLGSFSKNRIFNLPTSSPRVVGYVKTPLSSLSSTSESIVSATVSVVVGADSVVQVTDISMPRITTIKFLTLYGTVGGNVAYTFSQYQDVKFRDWRSVDTIGVDAKAYLFTGTSTVGDSSIYKQAPYLIMHFLKTEEGAEIVDGELVPAHQSSCKIRSIWNWAHSADSGNWGNLFQAYRYRRPLFISDVSDPFDNGFDTVVTKNKLRGRGRALSLYMETEPYRDCYILGWNLSLTGNSLA